MADGTPRRVTRIEEVEIDKITIGNRLRGLRDVAGMIDSIKRGGLHQAIILTTDLRLIDGAHRLECFRQLGRTKILASIVDKGILEARLIEIDSNLERIELTRLEKAQHIAERKRVYEELHPETRHGGAFQPKGEGAGRGKASRTKDPEFGSLVPKPFIEDTAEKLGCSRSTVSNMAKIGSGFSEDELKLIRGTDLENNQTALMVILRHKDPVVRERLIRALIDSNGESVGEIEVKVAGVRQIRSPQHVIELDNRIMEAKDQYGSDEEIAQALGIPVSRVWDTNRKSKYTTQGLADVPDPEPVSALTTPPPPRDTKKSPLRSLVENAWGARSVWESVSEETLRAASADQLRELLAVMKEESQANAAAARLVKKAIQEGK